MTLDEYQQEAGVTAKSSVDLTYTVLGLNGEAGEVAEKLKKALRDKGGILSPRIRGEMALELGDVLWYVAVCANRLGYSLDEIGRMNISKLESRQARGVIGGSGDSR